MIKKLIIPAAGQKIILLFSVIKELHNKKIWDINNINEISGTSAGSIIAVLLALKQFIKNNESNDPIIVKKKGTFLIKTGKNSESIILKL